MYYFELILWIAEPFQKFFRSFTSCSRYKLAQRINIFNCFFITFTINYIHLLFSYFSYMCTFVI